MMASVCVGHEAGTHRHCTNAHAVGWGALMLGVQVHRCASRWPQLHAGEASVCVCGCIYRYIHTYLLVVGLTSQLLLPAA